MRVSTLGYVLGLASASTVCIGAAHAQDPRAAIEAGYGQIHAAYAAHDGAALSKLVTPDFSATDIQGTPHTLAEVVERLKSGADSDPSRTVPKILTITTTGDKASTSVQIDLKVNRPGPDGNPVALDVTVINGDEWVNQGGKWLMQKSAQKDLTVKKDGEVVFHQAN